SNRSCSGAPSVDLKKAICRAGFSQVGAIAPLSLDGISRTQRKTPRGGLRTFAASAKGVLGYAKVDFEVHWFVQCSALSHTRIVFLDQRKPEK
ncbi:MAG: hypothetical protein AB8B94_07015, partial [Hyphomicrobiales bacterium]